VNRLRQWCREQAGDLPQFGPGVADDGGNALLILFEAGFSQR
jgi:hypothetical protein